MNPSEKVACSRPYEILHLRNALKRLEDVGETNSPTVANLKRIVILRIAELEVTLEARQRLIA